MAGRVEIRHGRRPPPQPVARAAGAGQRAARRCRWWRRKRGKLLFQHFYKMLKKTR
jgi:hypothetical protein